MTESFLDNARAFLHFYLIVFKTYIRHKCVGKYLLFENKKKYNYIRCEIHDEMIYRFC